MLSRQCRFHFLDEELIKSYGWEIKQLSLCSEAECKKFIHESCRVNLGETYTATLILTRVDISFCERENDSCDRQQISSNFHLQIWSFVQNGCTNAPQKPAREELGSSTKVPHLNFGRKSLCKSFNLWPIVAKKVDFRYVIWHCGFYHIRNLFSHQPILHKEVRKLPSWAFMISKLIWNVPETLVNLLNLKTFEELWKAPFFATLEM